MMYGKYPDDKDHFSIRDIVITSFLKFNIHIMKTILYATDYSQNSVAALLFANALAKKLDAQSVVMHVFDLPFSLASPVSIFYLEKEKNYLWNTVLNWRISALITWETT